MNDTIRIQSVREWAFLVECERGITRKEAESLLYTLWYGLGAKE